MINLSHLSIVKAYQSKKKLLYFERLIKNTNYDILKHTMKTKRTIEFQNFSTKKN